MSEAEQEDGLWKLLIFLQNCVFYTTHGLKFTYKICGGERFVNQKSKSITQITVFMVYNRGMELIELNGIVSSFCAYRGNWEQIGLKRWGIEYGEHGTQMQLRLWIK